MDYAARLTGLRQQMDTTGLDVVFLSIGSDLPYFTGYEAMPSERLTMLVVPAAGTPTMVVPQLEAPRVGDGPFEVRAWSETEDPVQLTTDLAGDPSTAAIGTHTWSGFLLALQERLVNTRFVSATGLTRPLRVRKDPAEIADLAEAATAADRVVERLRGERFSGLTERQLAQKVAGLTVEEGHELAAFNIVASGPNGASPHHEPGDRVIERGDTVVVDFGGRIRGYYSDCTRTFVVGAPTPEQVAVHAAVRHAQRAATKAVQPGVAAEEIDRAARRVIEGAGFGEHFIHRVGHGIGLEVHEHPYLVEGNKELLEPGMCFSIEPGIYLPGRFGVRLEDIVTVTEDGVEPLNKADHSLIEVE
jgi:Xaa-Pro aminopeptidase